MNDAPEYDVLPDFHLVRAGSPVKNYRMAHPDSWPKSIFARNLTEEAGITELMDDLGEALTLGRGKIRMMGGGNPPTSRRWRRSGANECENCSRSLR